METKKISTIELGHQNQQHQVHPGYPVGDGYSQFPLPPPQYGGGGPVFEQPMGQNGPPGPISYQQYPPPYGPPPNQPPPQINPAALPPQPPPNCPPGLEYLALIDQLLVHQQIELLEVVTGFETENKYKIRNTLGQDVYFAAEDSDFCSRNCCGPVRPFVMKVFDNFRNEVIHMDRPLACQSCCFPCCLQTLEVSAPPGNVIGSVEQEWSIFYPSFKVKDANGDTVFRIKGPFFTCSCGNDVVFRLTTADGSEDVGKITKQWSGFIREAYTDADNFGINFPMSVDVKMKAVLLGALFLIDFMYFETKQNNN